MCNEMSAVYKVVCPSCGRPYDAMRAMDCDCLETVRSFRCPHCAACFCKAPQSFKSIFWAGAPRDLVERRKQQPPASTGESVEILGKDIVRPLVLFAEDDPTARAIARRVIETMRCTVITAKDGEEALSLAREHMPDLVITDALMPRIDGREVARIIKAEMPTTRVVVITGVYKDRRYRDEAMYKFKVDDYIAKPVTPWELRDIIERFLPTRAAV